MSSAAKSIALAIIPKITGGISFVCSTFIVQHIIRNRNKRSQTYHRLIMGMSISDMFGSFFGFFLSTWPFPTESGIWGAAGSLQSCDAAGFFNHAGNVCTPLYNGSLATFYLLLLRYNWSDRRIKQIEPILHAVPLLIGWSTAIAGLVMNLFAPANWICWIAPYPKGCIETNTCVRGFADFNIYRWAFLYAEVWATIVYVAIIMTMIYFSVRRLETRSSVYEFSGSNTNTEDLKIKREKSKRVMKQAFLYVGAFFLTWIFGTITRLIQTINGQVFYPIIVLMTIFFPCQGLFNFLIYFKPRCCKCFTRKKKRQGKNVDSNGQVLPKIGTSKMSTQNGAEYSESEDNVPPPPDKTNNNAFDDVEEHGVEVKSTVNESKKESTQQQQQQPNNQEGSDTFTTKLTAIQGKLENLVEIDSAAQDDDYLNFNPSITTS